MKYLVLFFTLAFFSCEDHSSCVSQKEFQQLESKVLRLIESNNSLVTATEATIDAQLRIAKNQQNLSKKLVEVQKTTLSILRE